MVILSFQGIADRVAEGFINQHGNLTWAEIEGAIGRSPSCHKLGGYWLFHGCAYQKGTQTCADPYHFQACPLPKANLRNGRLNQLAYSLFLFIRDIADGDLVAWLDHELAAADDHEASNRLAAVRDAIVKPLTGIYGVSDKVAAMAASMLLLGGGRRRPVWSKVGATFVVVDTLVHNFLHRTGILRRFHADHPYGPQCYRPGGCADVLASIAAAIDARTFNRQFPRVFPRFIQSAVWRYSAQTGFDVCNGNRVDDTRPCQNTHCRVRPKCDRIALSEI